jgi:hypothetical protein
MTAQLAARPAVENERATVADVKLSPLALELRLGDVCGS